MSYFYECPRCGSVHDVDPSPATAISSELPERECQHCGEQGCPDCIADEGCSDCLDDFDGEGHYETEDELWERLDDGWTD